MRKMTHHLGAAALALALAGSTATMAAAQDSFQAQTQKAQATLDAAIRLLDSIGSNRAGGGSAMSGGMRITFELDPTGAEKAKLGYYPVQVPLSSDKPAGITKEPTYRAKPLYGVVQVGNGPNSRYCMALDEPADAPYKIYFDKNRNGDLTDDGDGAWATKREGTRPMYGVQNYIVRASWGTPSQETTSGDYGLAFYRFVTTPAQKYLLSYRQAARTGTVTVNGKSHKAMLVDNDADALYSKPLNDGGMPIGGGTAARPIWLAVDMNDDGKYDQPELFDARSPFKLGSRVVVADIAMDGSSAAIMPTTRKIPERRVAERPALLAAGTAAPNFEAEAWGGGKLHLADYKGKVVILDFWATWCGPCQKSMPHIEKVYQMVKGKDIVVLGVCVWDDKEAYQKWVPENKSKYTFKFAFDSAGKDTANSIAAKLYKVSGIPTTYIIDKEGKVADSIVGFSDGDTRVEKALNKLGIGIATTTTESK